MPSFLQMFAPWPLKSKEEPFVDIDVTTFVVAWYALQDIA